jgi:hypothetical protein|tara:strand:+ start:122 stop:652 length:531 start_codon:yes stop_codon:yes gene_type:complete
MNKTTYKISHFNNELKVFKADKKEIIFSSFWFMEFGKTCAEIKNSKEEHLYTITKKFQFWKWRMVYLIKNKNENKFILISTNNRNTIFKIEIDDTNFEIKINYKNKKSIYKNQIKIAEVDENLSEENFKELITTDKNELEIVFLLYTCLLVGKNHENSGSILTSQKQLETNEDPWT